MSHVDSALTAILKKVNTHDELNAALSYLHQARSGSDDGRLITFEFFAKMMEAHPLRCTLCTTIMIEPVTGPCGHSFCRLCIEVAEALVFGSGRFICQFPSCDAQFNCENRSTTLTLVSMIGDADPDIDRRSKLRKHVQKLVFHPEECGDDVSVPDEAQCAIDPAARALRCMHYLNNAQSSEAEADCLKLLDRLPFTFVPYVLDACIGSRRAPCQATSLRSAVVAVAILQAHGGGAQLKVAGAFATAMRTLLQAMSETLSDDHVLFNVSGATQIGSVNVEAYVSGFESVAHDANGEECAICTEILLDPVTVACGHTFDRRCLARVVDFLRPCPMCRAQLPGFISNQSHPNNVSIERCIELNSQEALNARRVDMEAEELALRSRVPMFVCTVAWPGVACPLHVFEPRYRLMVRRCSESGLNRFGMLPYVPADASETVVGTMLKIRDVTMLPDGRSLIDTVGTRRFTCSNLAIGDGGYYVGDVEWLDDNAEVSDETRVVYERVRERLQALVEGMSPAQQAAMVENCGVMPEEIHKFAWWALGMLGVQGEAGVALLTASLSERMHVLDVITSQATQRCTIQ